ncbi:hypothetical protein GCM10009665_46970 [Kitasatospora nipponensis]|uniref:Secreted protein n=1 Tax=Kitasatospora nipponensis TaxID=258049 RepID=A0ABP4H9J5_9ACTN
MRTVGTPLRLRRTAQGWLLCAVLLWAVPALVLGGAHGAVSAAQDHAAPAVVDAAQVGAYLADADRVATAGFVAGTVQLSGPGQQYQDDLKSAEQALERAAGHDANGAGQLQTVEGLLVEYTSLIEQAHANAGRNTLSTAYLGYAAGVMNAPDTGILAQVAALQAAEQDRVDRQRHSGWLAPAVQIGMLAPAVPALVLLVSTQRFLSRHFRRRLNPGLLAATVLLLALSGWTAAEALRDYRAFTTACDRALPRLTAGWQARTLTARAAGGDALAVFRGIPGQPLGGDFGTTLAPLTRDAGAPAPAPTLAPAPGDLASPAGAPSQGKLAQLLAGDLAGADPADGRRAGAEHLLQDYRRFTDADAALRQRAGTLGQDAAPATDPATVAAAVGPAGTQLGGAVTALDADLAARTTLARQDLAGAEATAGSDQGLSLALPLLCAALAGLGLAGLWPRIDEYRAPR